MHFQTLLGAEDGVAKFTSLVRARKLSLVLVLVNDCHSDVSTVNNSDSDAFGCVLRIINWSPCDKSAQQVSNKKSNDIISPYKMH